MLQKRIQGTKSSTILILLTWLVCAAFAGAGAIIAAGLLDNGESRTVGDALSRGINLIVIDFFIFLGAIVAAIILSRKLGLAVSGNRGVTKLQVSTLFIGLLGIIFGLGTWIQIGKSPKPSILKPMAVAVVVQICLYVFASSLMYTTSDLVRKKVWTPIVYITLIIAPSVIIYTFAQRT